MICPVRSHGMDCPRRSSLPGARWHCSRSDELPNVRYDHGDAHKFDGRGISPQGAKGARVGARARHRYCTFRTRPIEELARRGGKTLRGFGWTFIVPTVGDAGRKGERPSTQAPVTIPSSSGRRSAPTRGEESRPTGRGGGRVGARRHLTWAGSRTGMGWEQH